MLSYRNGEREQAMPKQDSGEHATPLTRRPMLPANLRIQKFGGGTFIVAGVLLLAANLLLVFLPVPPTTQGDFSKWITANSLTIALANESLFFATAFLVPSFIALGRLLGVMSKVSAFAGLSIIALALPLLAMLNVAQGRLVYPVYGLNLSVDSLKLSFSIFYGGLHATALMFGAALFFIGFAMRGSTFNKGMAPYSVVVGGLQIVGAYPWLTPIAFNVLVAISLTLWMTLTGSMMIRVKPIRGD
jgi:hypothetical protein